MTAPTARPLATGDHTRVDLFLAEVAQIQKDDGSRDSKRAKAGLGLMVVGVLLAVLALLLSQLTDNFLNQMTDLSLGISGLALVVLGAALFLHYSLTQFLRFWMLRVIVEQQDRR